MNIPRILLNDSYTMPQIGLGVWQAKNGEEVQHAVHAAIDNGYRLIDTAALYANEDGVGEAIASSGVPREEIFLTTKLWNADHGYDNALRAFDASLERLGTEYVDLYLIHWPVPQTDKYVETWHALEEIKKSGRAKSIGVCNFPIPELERLIAESDTVPAINQIELHPRLQQQELRDYCASKGIHVESWSPIGGTGGDLLDDPILVEIAKKHTKSSAQVVIRWHIQLGLIVIPKSVHPDRIAQNIDVFDFSLSDDDMTQIASLNTNTRRGPDPSVFGNHMNTGVVRLAQKFGIGKLKK
ncbi:MAG: glyoxal reductase [Candidatus Saccharibacteria bacterium]|nr:glyoxal reductase [Candidatus Saccharibacteria bacterium]